MEQIDMLEELKNLANPERFEIIEVALRLIREELQKKPNRKDREDIRQQLVEAAKTLLPDYSAGSELTIFTAQESEDFNEAE